MKQIWYLHGPPSGVCVCEVFSLHRSETHYCWIKRFDLKAWQILCGLAVMDVCRGGVRSLKAKRDLVGLRRLHWFGKYGFVNFCNYPLQFIMKHRIYIDNFWQHIWKYISLKVVRNLWSWSWSWSGSCSGWRSWWWSWPGPWAGHYEKCSTSRIAKCFGILELVVCIELEIREWGKKIFF